MPLKHCRKTITKTKRGDTIIEVMIGIAVFSFVTVLTVAVMNSGLASAERSLELVTARNELNAQAEALRFIHSSYASELSLPECDEMGSDPTGKCQKFRSLWNLITSRAKRYDDLTIEYPVLDCQSVYQTGGGSIYNDNAFVINTRLLETTNNSSVAGGLISSRLANAYIQAKSDQDIFRAPLLNARIIYTRETGGESDAQLSDVVESGLTVYDRVEYVEGIWVVAVQSDDKILGTDLPEYYDFYIETCWNGAGDNASTSLDTTIRLYNPNARS